MSHLWPYLTYKDSGIAWLGNVPAHWEVKPIKNMANTPGTCFIDGDWIESKNLSENGIRYITTGNVGPGVYKEQGGGYISEETFRQLQCVAVHLGDVLISRLNVPIGRACIVPDLCSRVVTSVDNVIFRPSNEYLRKYVVYRFSGADYFHEMWLLASGATMQRISRRELGNVRIAWPPKNEQIAIVEYLDRETAHIDALIEKKTRFIELLREKRQAFITQTVTKGLDPDVTLKDSGVEWLGMVPEHWDVKPLKYIVTHIGSGKTPNGGAETYQDSGVIFLRSQNIYEDGLRLDDVAYISHEVDREMKNSRVLKNDVLLNITGGSIGRFCHVSDEIGAANVNQHVCIIRLVDVRFSKWISFILASHVVQEQIGYQQNGAGREGLNFEQIGNMIFPLPDLVEAESLVNSLRQATQRFDLIINKTELSIELLKERRIALITASVTGQIDLRESA